MYTNSYKLASHILYMRFEYIPINKNWMMYYHMTLTIPDRKHTNNIPFVYLGNTVE